MIFLLEAGSGAAALVSAALWFWAGVMKLPRATVAILEGGVRKPPQLETAMKRQGLVNAAAAIMAGVAALLQAGTSLLQARGGF